MEFVWGTYLVAVILAIILIICYGIWMKKSDEGKTIPRREVSNKGEPISGGVKHFKIVNR